MVANLAEDCQMTRSVTPKVRTALDATGLPWEIVNGKKHRKLMLDGRQIAVLSHGGHSRRMKSEAFGEKALLCHIRNAISASGQSL